MHGPLVFQGCGCGIGVCAGQADQCERDQLFSGVAGGGGAGIEVARGVGVDLAYGWGGFGRDEGHGVSGGACAVAFDRQPRFFPDIQGANLLGLQQGGCGQRAAIVGIAQAIPVAQNFLSRCLAADCAAQAIHMQGIAAHFAVIMHAVFRILRSKTCPVAALAE